MTSLIDDPQSWQLQGHVRVRAGQGSFEGCELRWLHLCLLMSLVVLSLLNKASELL